MQFSQGKAASFLQRLNSFESLVTTCAFIVLIGTMFADVLSRELTGVGLHWARQVGVYANIVVVMIGLGLASAGGAHLRPRFADNWLPAKWNPALERIQDFLMALFCFAVALIATQATLESAVLGEVSALLPVFIWPFLGVIPLAFFLVALRHVLYCLYPGLKPPDPVKQLKEEESR